MYYVGFLRTVLSTTWGSWARRFIPVQILKRTRIAQLLLEKIDTTPLELSKTLKSTDRDNHGFGSTGTSEIDQSNKNISNPQSCVIKNVEINRPALITMDQDGDGPYLDIELRVKGVNNTLGLNITTNTTGNLILIDCQPSTPAARIPKWRFTLRNARVKEIYGNIVKTKNDVIAAISKARTDKVEYITCKFATEKRVNIHPQHGIPQLHYDQLSILSRLHYEARTGKRFVQVVEDDIPTHHSVEINKIANNQPQSLIESPPLKHPEAGLKFTRGKLLQRND